MVESLTGRVSARPNGRGVRSLAVVVASFASLALIASSGEEAKPEKVSSTESGGAEASNGELADPSTPAEFAIGDVVRLGDFEVVVHSANPVESSNQFIEPDAGHIFIGVDVEVKNNSASAETISSLAQFEVQDAAHRAYSPELFIGENFPEIDGEAPAGGSRRGTVVFEVPADSSGLKLNFTGGWFSSGTASIRLMP